MNRSKAGLHYFIDFLLPDLILCILCKFLSDAFTSDDPMWMLVSYIFIFPIIVPPYIGALAVIVPICETMGFRHYLSGAEHHKLMNIHSAVQLIVSAAAAVLLTAFSLDHIAEFIGDVSGGGLLNAFIVSLYEPFLWSYFFPMILVVSNVTAAVRLRSDVLKNQR